eukprot:GHVU01069796.1.p1 GENE.GHVU01069796.1~~GHVU01069796.1.p1  ORF type:complete len:207 (+),score=10.10 GHVU01069796.1:477-1097(+)
MAQLSINHFDYGSIPKNSSLYICGSKPSVLNFLTSTEFVKWMGDKRSDKEDRSDKKDEEEEEVIKNVKDDLIELVESQSTSNLPNGGAACSYWRRRDVVINVLLVSSKASRHNCQCRPEQLRSLVQSSLSGGKRFYIIAADDQDCVLPWTVAVSRCFSKYHRKSTKCQLDARICVFLRYIDFINQQHFVNTFLLIVNCPKLYTCLT